MGKILDHLKDSYENHHKQLVETPEDAHTDKLLQLRMSNLHIFITQHYPDNPERRRMLAHVHELQKLSHEALEHKE